MIKEECKRKFYNIAALYLQEHFEQGTSRTWIRNVLTNPRFADFIFLYENQIYTVILAGVKIVGKTIVPNIDRSEVERLIHISEANSLIPCLMLFLEKELSPLFPNGWNLIDAREYLLYDRARAIIPEELSDDEEVEMSPWECQDMATLIVRQSLKKAGTEVLSYQDTSMEDAQIMIRTKEGNRGAIFVRYSIYPVQDAEVPKNISSLMDVARKKHKAELFYFASVSFAPREGKDHLIRSQELRVKFSGLVELTSG
ncbi:MAG: hypothetical protein K6G51_06265 [Sphaerochaetaceae bacterium]|nr:hypothetical protein [Sphaerochaetaceae bacterium]